MSASQPAIDALIRQRDDAKRDLAAVTAERDALKRRLDSRTEDARAAGWEAALVRVGEQVQKLRTEGP